MLLAPMCGFPLHQDFPSIWGEMIHTFGSLQLHSELIQYLQEIHQRLFPDINNADWQKVCEEFIKPFNNPRDNKVFRFLVKCSVSERLNAIGVRKWRTDIQNLVYGLHLIEHYNLTTDCDTVHSKLISYEQEYRQLKDATLLLELALWKSEIDQNYQTDEQLTADTKGQCRVTCGAGIIIPNILPYLIGK